jgi:hypothetical protein
MRTIFFTIGFVVAGGVGQALAAPSQTGSAVFSALTVSTGQSARTIISNVSASDGGSTPAACQFQVKFFGPDGTLVGNGETVRLKPGESRSVTVSQVMPLLRASVSIEGDVEASRSCELKARLEVFDLQTGTTFVSVVPDQSDAPSGCSASPSQSLVAAGQDATASIGRRRVWRRRRTWH